METYLDNLAEYNQKIVPVFAALGKEARLLYNAGREYNDQVRAGNWYQQLVFGSNDTNQTDNLRLILLTLLVDAAKLNQVPLVNVFGLTQAIGDATISATTWDLIGGDLNDNAQLIAKFNTYLPLTAGVTKPLTGALYFGGDGLGIDVINEGDTLNIGASAGVVQFGVDAEIKMGNVVEGAWLADNIGVTKGGLGSLNFASGTNGQAIIKSGSGYAFYTIPAIPSLSGYIKADGTVPMTADLRFSPNFGIDTNAAGQLRIGQSNATSVRIYPSLTVGTVAAGTWNGDGISLAYGGTGANLSAPASSSFLIYDSGASSFATIGDNLSLSGGIINLASALTGIDWRGSTIAVSYGGTGLSTIGAEGTVLTVVSGAPAWTTFSALTNPMDGAGQMIYGGVGGTPTKLDPNATSTNKFLRSVSSGDPSWQILVAGDIPNIAQSQVTGLTTALTNKLSTVLTDGYMYVGNAANAAVGVEMYGDATIDNTGSLLIADEAVTFAKMQNITATTLVGRWSAGDGPMQEVTIGSGLSLSLAGVLTSGGLVNPMTTIGDMIIGDTGGDPIRLAAGTNGYILTMVSGSPAWAVAASGSGNVVGPGPTVVANNFAVYNGTGGLTIGEPTGAALDGSGNASFLSVRVTGTGGAGHMHFRHQASVVSGIANSNTIYALPVASGGFGFVINNNAYASSLIFGASAARTYTLPDSSGTFTLLGNSSTGSGSIVLDTSPTLTTSLLTGSTTFSLLNTTATTVNFAGAATTLNMGGSGAAINLGGGAAAAELRFLEPSGSGTNYTAFKAQAQSANVTYTLPAADGSSGQVLSTNGSGALSWVSGSGSGNVVGPGSSTDGNFAVFNGTTGLLLASPTVATLDTSGNAMFARVTMGTASSITGQAVFANSANGFTTTIQQSTSAASSLTYFWPTTAPAAGNILSSDASGNLSWTAAGAGNMVLATAGQVVTGSKIFNTGTLIIAGSSSGQTILNASATAGGTITFPALSGTVALLDQAQTFSAATKTFNLAAATGTAIAITGTGSTGTAQITFSGATMNWINFGSSAIAAAPTITTARSVGTRIVIANTFNSGVGTDFAIGFVSNELWLSAGTTAQGVGFYGGATRFGRFITNGLTLDMAGSLANPNLLINGGASTIGWMSFGTNGIAAPTITTNRSVGTKIVLNAAFNSGVGTDFAIGINTNDLWLSTYDASSTISMYAGATRIAFFGGGAGVGLTFADAQNIVFNATTGTKIGTATTQKLSFWNKTPIVQPTTGITGATRVGGAGTTVTTTDTYGGYTLAQIAAALVNVGILA